ncbi:MAG: FHA domain-containing protein [Planctomycetota bacterium]
MTFQYSLRFESGERRGEVVPLTIVAASGGSFTIGRQPGNSLQVTDPSISGRHAELEVDEYGVNLRDLNSTNGTLVAGRKVRQTSLEIGDEFTLGAVEFTLLEGAEAGSSAGSSAGGDELVLEDGGELELELEPAPAAAAMPRKAPKPAPAASAPATVSPPRRTAKPAPAAMESLGATQIVPHEDGLEITAEDLARSAKSSKLGPILLVGLAALGGGAWWFLGQRSESEDGGGRSAAVAPPKAPAGNLLTAGYSFEKTDGWISEGEGSAEFAPARSARRTGSKGIQADLTGGDVAVIASEAVRVTGSDRTFRASGFVRADEGVELRVGLRYSDGAEAGVRSTVWSVAVRPSADDFEEVSFSGTAPSGLDRVEVLLRAECTDAPAAVDAAAEGDEGDYTEFKSISLDDVALVPASEGGGAAEIGTLAVTTLASAADGAPLALGVTTLNAPLVSSVRIAEKAGSDGFGLGSVPFRLVVEGGAVKITPTSAGQLILRGEAALVDGGIATLAEGGGYAIHGGTFERGGVTDLILGSDAQMVALSFPEPVELSARPSGGGVAFRAATSGIGELTLQLSFMEQRTRAQRLARRAKEERSAGDSGAALATWAELLREVPYDTNLIADATSAQGEMLSMGRAELKALGEEVERARFFRLADLFREKLARAEDVATRFRGSDVEAQAIALRDAIKLELSALDSNSTRDELIRLEAIRSVMERDGAEGLAARVRAYASREGVSTPQANTDQRFGGYQ